MAIGFQDFLPRVVKQGFLFNEYETLAQTLERANAWLAQTQAQVINVETVVLPNISKEEETTAREIDVVGQGATWRQFIRVWYVV